MGGGVERVEGGVAGREEGKRLENGVAGREESINRSLVVRFLEGIVILFIELK